MGSMRFVELDPLERDNLVICAGNASPALARRIANTLKVRMLKSHTGPFSDGEIGTELLTSPRHKHVYVVQSLSSPQNDHIMELMLLADNLRRSDAASINFVVPYLGYSRQDRRPRRERTAIAARVVADMFQDVAKIDRMITMDVHANQIQGFYTIPFINAEASARFISEIYSKYQDPVIVSPDAGGAERARGIAKQIDADLAIIDKRRPKANQSSVMNILGDVEGRDCIIVDDLVDTAGTLCLGAAALKDRGANRVVAYCAHGVLSGNAIRNINGSVLDEMVVTDTIDLSPGAIEEPKIRFVSVTAILAEIVRRVHEGESVSKLYPD